MGYTIYWYREKSMDQNIFNYIIHDFSKIQLELNRNEILLAGPAGNGCPVINEKEVSFNGSFNLKGGCCEPFNFERSLNSRKRELEKGNGKYLRYVKTEGLPYSIAVATFLIIAKHYLKNKINITADDPISFWEKPRNWCQHILGYGGDFLPENNSGG